ncbi:MAG: calcium-binding protein [Myxococcaceae bacterium]|nr:calcium-binding protein [Myxococcaceae bacterium]
MRLAGGRALVAMWCALTLSCGAPRPDAPPAGRITPADETLALAQPCALSNNVVTVVLSANETATLTLDGTGALLVNGQACGAATQTNARRITVSVQSPGDATDETLVIDGTNGFFGLGSSTGGGITIALGAGTDTVQLIGSAGADVLIAGRTTTDDWVIVNQDLFKDVSVTGVEALTLTGAGGADLLSGSGLHPTWLRASYYSSGLPTQRLLTLEGGAGDDTLVGGEGADVLRGGTEADALTGGAGADTLYGDAGDDLIDEGSAASGADVFNGGAGTDTVRYAARSNAVTVTLGSGANDGEPAEGDDVRDDLEIVVGSSGGDTLTCSITTGCTLRGGPGDDTLTGNSGADTLEGEAGDDVLRPGTGADTLLGGAGVDTVTYSDRTGAVTVTLGAPGVASTGNGAAMEGDSLTDLENVVGGSGADTLTGNSLANRLTGGAGADTLSGGDGDDVFDEGAAANGADVIAGGGGIDRVDYSARTTALTVSLDGTANDGAASEGDDVEADVERVDGGSGNDTLTGNADANELNGNGGDDTLSGLGGRDVLSGGPGNDSLAGGEGDDILEDIVDGGTCDCGPGFDIAICPSPGDSCEVR